MIVGRIRGTTRVIGKSQGYIGLPLRDVLLHDTVNGPDTPAMQTAWEPTPAEIAAITEGKPIILTILGTAHPPVSIHVGDDDDEPARKEGQQP